MRIAWIDHDQKRAPHSAVASAPCPGCCPMCGGQVAAVGTKRGVPNVACGACGVAWATEERP